jgi:Family of unknown function (DUF5343)
MALPSSYFTSTKNLPAILDQMQRAQIPPKFTYDHLKQMGFPSSNDRPIIPILKALRFLDASGTPQERYRRFKGTPAQAKRVMAEGIKDAYTDVFAIDESAHGLPPDQLKGIFGRLSGKGEAVTEKMAKTFRALVEQADFSVSEAVEPGGEQEEQDQAGQNGDRPGGEDGRRTGTLTLRHDVHVHLPASDDIKVYDAIFRSLRENLLP